MRTLKKVDFHLVGRKLTKSIKENPMHWTRTIQVRLVMVICLVLSVQLHAQRSYYGNNQQEYLTVDSTLLMVAFSGLEVGQIEFVSPSPEDHVIFRLGTTSVWAIRGDNPVIEPIAIADFPDSVYSVDFSYGYRNSSGVLIYPTNQVLVSLSPGVVWANPLIQSVLIDFNASVFYDSGRVARVRVDHIDDSFHLANSLYETGLFRYAQPDFGVAMELFSDPLYPAQFPLSNTTVINGPDGVFQADICAEEAWETTTGSSDITIAVVDSGCEWHEDLLDENNESRVLLGHNDQQLPPTGNESPQQLEAWTYGDPWYPHPGNTSDYPSLAHGQSVAGIVAASHNDIGVRGVAPNCLIYPVNVFTGTFIDDFISPVGDIVAAIDALIDLPIDVVVGSWGYASIEPPAIDWLFTDLTTLGRGGLGCVVIFAAGNEQDEGGGISYPASHPDVIAVGAISQNGVLTNYSNVGPELDLVAPSSLTMSSQTGPPALDRMGILGFNEGNYVSTFGGTSAAAPLVAGVAALLLSVNSDLDEGQLRNMLYASANDMNEVGFDNATGHGLVSACRALELLENAMCSEDVFYDYVSLAVTSGESVTLGGEVSIKEDLVVEGSGELIVLPGTILRFGPQGKFIVRNGADLSLNDITMTNACERMWWGVEVWGTEGELYPLAGTLEIADCVIENAHYAVCSGRHVADAALVEGIHPIHTAWKQGGILSCKTTDFINCAIGVYVAGSPIAFPRALSTVYEIEECRFFTQGGLLDNEYNLSDPYPYPNIENPFFLPGNSLQRGEIGVLLQGMRSAQPSPFEIAFCTFENLEIGIKGSNAYPWLRQNYFNEVQYGVYLDGSTLNGIYMTQVKVQIDRNTFNRVNSQSAVNTSDVQFPEIPEVTVPFQVPVSYIQSNSAAIRAENIGGLSIVDNSFGALGEIDYSIRENAIYLKDCPNHIISSQNQILGYRRGVIVADSDIGISGRALVGKEMNDQERNIFLSSGDALITSEDNYNFLFRCNDVVHPEDNPDVRFWQNIGVLGHQGSEPAPDFPNDNTTGAGNRFYRTIPMNVEMPGMKDILAVTPPFPDSGSDFDPCCINTAPEVIDPNCEGMCQGWNWISESAWEEAQNGFIYYHHGASDEDNMFRPKKFGTLHQVEVVALNIAYDDQSSCSSPYGLVIDGENIIHHPSSQDIAQLIHDETVRLQQTKEALDHHQQETYNMLTAIYGGIDNEYELKLYLLENSPLSAVVLEAYMQRYNVPLEYFVDVFSLNSVIETELLELLNEQIDSYPEAIKRMIWQMAFRNSDIQTPTQISRRIDGLRKLYQAKLVEEFSERIASNEVELAYANMEMAGGDYSSVLRYGFLQSPQVSQGMRDSLFQTLYDDLEDSQMKAAISWAYSASSKSELTESDVEALHHLRQQLNHPVALEILHGFENSIKIDRGFLIPEIAKTEVRKTTSQKKHSAEFIVYPNPAADYVRFSWPKGAGIELHYRILDTMGREVKSGVLHFQGEDGLLEIRELPAGQYSFELFHKYSTWSSSLIKK